jgi:uncharacterized protein (TIGR02186 family)
VKGLELHKGIQPLVRVVLALAAMLAAGPTTVHAQTPRPAPSAYQPELTTKATNPTYRLEADVSMRSIPVDIRFSGARLVMFGSASKLGPANTDNRALDIVAVVQGARSRMTVRKKTNVWGLWINTGSVDFENSPRYYAIASTRRLEAIATPAVLAENGIGLEQITISLQRGEAAGIEPLVLNEYRQAAITLGIRQKQYRREDYGINFVGTSLFRGQIDLPATIPVGQLDVSVFLFRGGELLTRTDAKVNLARQGFEQFIYQFANANGMIYGIATVLLAVLIGSTASFIVSLRRP